MPELPEVETICQGLKRQILNLPIQQVSIYQYKLRWPIPKDLNTILKGESFLKIERRGKYLLLNSQKGTAIIHLGLSGRLMILPTHHKKNFHEHLTIHFANLKDLSFIDPRKFGAFLWTYENPAEHVLLKDLGPEPLTKDFNSEYLLEKIRRHKISIKQFLMDSHIIAGIGNIYANEALFIAKINPLRSVDKLTKEDCEVLTRAIKEVLNASVKKGGTTIKDFIGLGGEIGRFQNELMVYACSGKPCVNCQSLIKEIRLGGRSTFYCAQCQK